MADKLTGAPTKMTEERVKFFEELLGEGQFIETACALVGISRTTYYDWYNNQEPFRTRMDKALYAWVRKQHSTIGEEDKWKILKNRMNHLYRDRIEQEISGNTDQPIKLIIEDHRTGGNHGEAQTKAEAKTETHKLLIGQSHE